MLKQKELELISAFAPHASGSRNRLARRICLSLANIRMMSRPFIRQGYCLFLAYDGERPGDPSGMEGGRARRFSDWPPVPGIRKWLGRFCRNNKGKWHSRSIRPIVALVFTMVGLYWRFQTLANRNLWTDELNQIKNTLGPFKPFWLRLTYGERTCFPGEYLLNYPFVQIFGHNKWGLAIPHILFSIAGFIVLYLLCRQYFRTLAGFTAAFALYSLNKNLVYHAFEFRPYAVLPTLALIVFYLGDKIVRPERLGSLRKTMIGLFLVLTVMYHAYGIMIIGCCLLFFVLSETEHRPLKDVCRSVVRGWWPFGLAGMLVFFWYATGGTTLSYSFATKVGMNTFDYIPNPIVNLNNFLRTVFGNMTGVKKLKWLINGILLAFIIPHKERYRQVGFFLIVVIVPIQLKLLADLHAGYWFLHRQIVWVMALYAFFVGWCWDSVIAQGIGWRRRKAGTAGHT